MGSLWLMHSHFYPLQDTIKQSSPGIIIVDSLCYYFIVVGNDGICILDIYDPYGMLARLIC